MRAYALVSIGVGVSILFGSSGCATIVQGRYQDLTINSNPPGASFEVDGLSGTTPATVPVRRKDRQHIVTISKPGYETQQISIGRDLNLWLAGNALFGLLGVPCVGVDLVSGGGYKLNDNTVAVQLRQETGTGLAQQPIPRKPTANDGTIVEAQHTTP
jgi:hypothetical protein